MPWKATAVLFAFGLGPDPLGAQVTVVPKPLPPIHGAAPCPLRAEVSGTSQTRLVWSVRSGPGRCVEGRNHVWHYHPPAHRPQAVRGRLRATSLADARVYGEIPLDLLPTGTSPEPVCPSPPALLLRARPAPAGAPPERREKPFTDVTAGDGLTTSYGDPRPMHLIVGYGLPLTLRWTLDPGFRAAEQQLSLMREDQTWLKDLTGLDHVTLSPRHPATQCVLTVREPGLKAPGTTKIETFRLAYGTRGLLPFAGDPLARAVPGDGPGRHARFVAPLAMARVETTAGPAVFVTEAAGHALRRIDLGTGEAPPQVTTPLGSAGEAGHQDGVGAAARFHGPTHLAPVYSGDEAFLLVADSGNHLLRVVHGPDLNCVTTLAGSVQGHRDGPYAQCRFDDLRGFCMAEDGTIYVADRGNHVIRALRAGTAATLAGAPGQAGVRDGAGDQARFSDLKGLAFCEGRLYVTDGHALRRIDPATAVVETWCGQVQTPGFLAQAPAAPAPAAPGAPPHPALGPCLNDPQTVLASGSYLYVADAGNHCVQKLDPVTRRWWTVAGAPESPEVRWGRCRDGVPAPLGPGFAALRAPQGLARGLRGMLVATDRCVAELAFEVHSALASPRLELEAGMRSVAVGEPCAVRLTLHRRTVGRELERFEGETFDQARARIASLPLDLSYAVEFINADGTLATTFAGGRELLESPRDLAGVFTVPGPGRIRVRGVTAQGVGLRAEGGELTVLVREREQALSR